jgi:hypothetical protein
MVTSLKASTLNRVGVLERDSTVVVLSHHVVLVGRL